MEGGENGEGRIRFKGRREGTFEIYRVEELQTRVVNRVYSENFRFRLVLRRVFRGYRSI